MPIELPARGIDGGCIFEWSLGLGQNALGHLGLLLQEDGKLLGPLGEVAFLAGEREITEAVRAPVGTGH